MEYDQPQDKGSKLPQIRPQAKSQKISKLPGGCFDITGLLWKNSG